MRRIIPVKYRNGRWRADLVDDYKLVNQLRAEAGLRNAAWPDPPDAYDRLLIAAGNHDMGLETDADPPRLVGETTPWRILAPSSAQETPESPQEAG